MRLAHTHPPMASALRPDAERRLRRALEGANDGNRPAIERLLRQSIEMQMEMAAGAAAATR